MTIVVTQGIDEGNVFLSLLEVGLKTRDGKFSLSDDCGILVPHLTKADFNQLLSH